MVAAVVENFGYRQWLAFVRTRACLRIVRRHEQGWGEMTRVGFGGSPRAGAAGVSTPGPG